MELKTTANIKKCTYFSEQKVTKINNDKQLLQLILVSKVNKSKRV